MVSPQAQRGFLGFIVQMAALASVYLRNHQMRHLVGQQQLWTQLENFSRQIHATLNPTEVAYQDPPVAFDVQGNRLVLDPERRPATPVIAVVPDETDLPATPSAIW